MRGSDDGTHWLGGVTSVIEVSMVLLRTILPNMVEIKCGGSYYFQVGTIETTAPLFSVSFSQQHELAERYEIVIALIARIARIARIASKKLAS